MKNTPLWRVLIERGLCADRREATGWIMAGRVYVNDRRVDKEGNPVPADAAIRIRGLDLKYVSRGGLKLEGALADLALDVAGRVVLDAGASTGGFTDCLLRHGASLIFAVDAGFGQLAGRLRCDPRVVNLERTNIADLAAGRLQPRPDLATVDLSYISLRKAIPVLGPLLVPDGAMLCLVKPLFEVADRQARRTGRIADPGVYRDVLRNLTAFALDLGYVPAGIARSRPPGAGGTMEFFLHLSLVPSNRPSRLEEQIERAVEGVGG